MSEHAHREAQDLLPWLANGTLAGTELERVQAHLKGCAQCRADLAALHTLRAAAPPASFDLDMESALARLLPQLSAPPQAASLPARSWRARLAANDARWLRVAAGVQCCAIVVLAALLLRPGAATDAGAYHVLGAAATAQTRLIVMFKPDTPERELRRVVLESGARIVGGPTATGAWVLGTEQAADAVAGRLRGQAAVTLAEPLGAEGRP
jgi:anti-sigma factor RsiW